MSLFARTRQHAPAVEERSVQLPAYLVEHMRAALSSGHVVTRDGSYRHPAVWSCIKKISEDVAMMPVDVVRYQGNRRVPVEPVPQIIAAPSVFHRSLDWRQQVVRSWLDAGNAWGLVTQTTSNGAYPTRIELQNPDDVVPAPDVKDGPAFRVRGQVHWLWPVGDLWHEPAHTVAGQLLGMNPIAYHALTISGGMLAQQFGADFFTSGGHPSAILAPDRDPGQEGAKAIKEAFIRAASGREPAVLPQSIAYTAVQINPDDSQFLETISLSHAQVCGIFGEDPADHASSAAGGASSVTYANRSDADLARFKRRQFWVVKLQDALTALVPRPHVVRLNVNASLMMTTRERHELYGLRLQNRTTTINEVRTLEDEEQFGPEFDLPGIPPLTVPVDDTSTEDDPEEGTNE